MQNLQVVCPRDMQISRIDRGLIQRNSVSISPFSSSGSRTCIRSNRHRKQDHSFTVGSFQISPTHSSVARVVVCKGVETDATYVFFDYDFWHSPAKGVYAASIA